MATHQNWYREPKYKPNIYKVNHFLALSFIKSFMRGGQKNKFSTSETTHD